ncbi:sex-regulated protein janus-A-like [Cimex lectularius]|uniref:Janus A n=1 Tax=Cimex lectularius TaxID=79782 RepID=A0A8I6TB58_CIMLE|nr:sex-regulated protein janus-A-like [Cimex lectularius]
MSDEARFFLLGPLNNNKAQKKSLVASLWYNWKCLSDKLRENEGLDEGVYLADCLILPLRLQLPIRPADIYYKTVQTLTGLNLDLECLGGGRIMHDPAKKNIKVYGYSQGFGKADHQITVSILKTVYKDYEITWSDEGY